MNTSDGSWKAMGTPGEWKGTIAGTVIGNTLYTIETTGGALYATNLDNGRWTQLGKGYANTVFLTSAGTKLYTIETSGTLYEINASDGSWSQIGKTGDYKKTIKGVGVNSKLYTIESTGVLYETDPDTGNWKQIGQADFVNTTFLMAGNGKLHTLESSGSLYQVHLR